MPFIPPQQRLRIDMEGKSRCQSVGDLCYVEYKKLMEDWKKEPRWTTAHNITKEFANFESDIDVARFLAYMVWFNIHVMNYEKEKIKENGDIL